LAIIGQWELFNVKLHGKGWYGFQLNGLTYSFVILVLIKDCCCKVIIWLEQTLKPLPCDFNLLSGKGIHKYIFECALPENFYRPNMVWGGSA